jgi:hypothetical protein
MSWQTRCMFLAALGLLVFGIDQEDRIASFALVLVGYVCWAIDRLRRLP